MPFTTSARRLKRSIWPYVPDSTNSGFAVDAGFEMMGALRSAGVSLEGDLLEVGVGWTPIIPLLFHLSGTRSITLTDLELLYDERSAGLAIEFLRENEAAVLPKLGLTRRKFEEAVLNFRPVYLCPWNQSQSKDNSIDIVTSRSVLEHIPVAQLKKLFSDLLRIVRPGGHMCHAVDNTDHWQHHGQSLGLAHFLRFPSTSLLWRVAQLHKQGFTNRLRHSDYIALALETGWTICSEESRVPEVTLEQVREMRQKGLIAREFQHYETRDLATTATLLVVKKGL